MNVRVYSCLFCVHKGGNWMESKKKIRKGNRQKPTRIVVERVYLGGQSMEDAFRKINEETVKENIEEIKRKISLGKTV
jgi:hypothetical protein